jgi:ankyrin repeat protein
VTAAEFEKAVRVGDLEAAARMLEARAELANGPGLLIAVDQRDLPMVELLLDHGANPFVGVYPHRDATNPHAIAVDRGYAEIVGAIEKEEQRRRDVQSGITSAPPIDELVQAIASQENSRALDLLRADPTLVASTTTRGATALHAAARFLNVEMVESLLAQGADPTRRTRDGWTPIDLAAQYSRAAEQELLTRIANLLLRANAPMTASGAAALADQQWLEREHAAGTLTNPITDRGGLLRIAASHRHKHIVELLLRFGFDPNEKMRFADVGPDDVAYTWGMPLYECAATGEYEIAELLLGHGADPNGKVYASGDPMFQAFSRRDWKMVDLLTRYGGAPEATTAGLFRQTDLARRILNGEAKYKLEGVGGETLAEQLLWGAACGGDPEIVRMALEHIDRKRDDVWWFHILEQPLRVWNHGSLNDNPEWDRGTYVTCLRLLAERADPNLRGREEFGLTILHSIAGARAHVTPQERVAFAEVMLDAGARLDIRDGILRSTPLGWACRWGQELFVDLLLQRGADPIEADAEPWATPLAWAEKKGYPRIVERLKASGA